MSSSQRFFLFIALLPTIIVAQAPIVDSLSLKPEPRFQYKALLLPAALIGFGVVGLESPAIRNLNSSTQGELAEHIDEKLTIDDFSQYTPFLSVYALNAAGIQGKHNFRDRTTILATAYLIMGGTVTIIKSTGNEMRPDKTSNNSFPSGHTATAFMGAEFLYQEYRDVSVWYGVAGYAVATGTGFFRMYNNRHWLTDIAAGAGIGILSTKIAYWLHPAIQHLLFKKTSKTTGVLLPTYQDGRWGVGLSVSF